MSKIREIFQSVRPLLEWRTRGRQPETVSRAGAKQLKAESKAAEKRRSLVLPAGSGREKIEWIPVLDTKVVEQYFAHFRETVFELRQRSRRGAGQASDFIWETGRLAGSRSYFFLQPWNERGFLIEESPKGWVVARAEKIASQSQFIRDRLAWDHVMLYQAENSPGMVKLSSDRMGESLVSLALYEDFMLRCLRASIDPSTQDTA